MTPRWEAGLKWRYSSGLPDTPVLGTVYDSANNQYLPVYGAVNSVRLPDYQRLDISTSFTTLYDTWQWRVFLEILNVYDHDNVLGWDYNFDYTVRKEVKQLPLFPYLGLEAKF